MDIHKAAAWAQIMSMPTGAYSAYGTYVNLHPEAAGDPPSAMFNPVAFYISFGAFGACLLLMVIVRIADAFRSDSSVPVAVPVTRIDQSGPTAAETAAIAAENARLLKEIGRLQAELKDEISAKMDRETRLNLLRGQHDEMSKHVVGEVLTPLDASSVDNSRSKFSETATFVRFLNRSRNAVDIYWITFEGIREHRKQLPSGADWGPVPTFLTHPWLVVVSGTGTTARGTGVLLAGFEAQTSHQDLAVITDPYGPTDMRALPVNASVGDRTRRERAIGYFYKLSVPQKFVLRWIVKHHRIHHGLLVQMGSTLGFGNNEDGYVDAITNVGDLVMVEPGGNYLISTPYIDDVHVILSAWFNQISDPDVPL